MKTSDRDIERNYKWNFLVNTADSAMHGFSFGFVAVSTVLTLYVSRLTNDSLLIGLAAGIASSTFLIPQLFAAKIIEGMERTKPVVVKFGFFTERLPFLIMAISTGLFAKNFPGLALIIFFIALIWQGLGEGIVAIAWRDMLARLFPQDRRGRFFGISGFCESLFGALGAGVTIYVLGRFSFPMNFAALFLIAFLGLAIAWVFVGLSREPAKKFIVNNSISYIHYFRQFKTLFRTNSNFGKFIISRVLSGLGQMGIVFIIIYAVKQWDLSDSIAGKFSLTLLIAQMLASLVLGFLGDRWGHKINLIIQISSIILAMLVAIWAQTPDWLFFSYFCIGISSAIESISGQVIVFEFSEDHNRPTYIGLASTIYGAVGGISPVFGALILSYFGHTVLFGSAAILSVMALGFLTRYVNDPRVAKKVSNCLKI